MREEQFRDAIQAVIDRADMNQLTAAAVLDEIAEGQRAEADDIEERAS
jgi:hypothetical protein